MESDVKTWQVVKGKPGGVKKPKGAPSMTRGDGNFAATVKTESAFSAFAQEQEAQEARRANAQKKEKAEAAKKEEREIRPVRKPTNIDEALSFLDLEELERTLKQSEMMCPEKPAVWMNDVAAQLGTKLNTFACDPKDLLLTKKPPNFPSCSLADNVAVLLQSVVERNEEQTERFYETASNLLAQSRAGSPCWEYRLFIQIILRKYPHFAIRRLEKTSELLRKCSPHATETTQETMSIWCIQQALRGVRLSRQQAFALVQGSLLSAHALHVNKNVAHCALTALDLWLTESVSDRQLTAPLFTAAEYFVVFDAFFKPANFDSSKLCAQSEKLREKAERFFARFEQASISLEKKLSPYFVEYLKRLQPDSTARSICGNLLFCMRTDVDSMREWRRLFTSNVAQSCILLDYLRQPQAAETKENVVYGAVGLQWTLLRHVNRKEMLNTLSTIRNEARSQVLETQRRAAKKQKQQPKAANKRHLERVDEEDALLASLERVLELVDSALAAASTARQSRSNGAEFLSRTVAFMYLLVLVVVFVLLDYLYAKFVLKSRSPQTEMVSVRLANSFWNSRTVQTITADLNQMFTRVVTNLRKYESLNRLFDSAARSATLFSNFVVTQFNAACKYAEPYLQALLAYDYATLFDSFSQRLTQFATATRKTVLAAANYAQTKLATLTS